MTSFKVKKVYTAGPLHADCLQCCVASILGKERDEVPELVVKRPNVTANEKLRLQWQMFYDYLWEQGYTILVKRQPVVTPHIKIIGYNTGMRVVKLHAVVGENNQIIHDPAKPPVPHSLVNPFVNCELVPFQGGRPKITDDFLFRIKEDIRALYSNILDKPLEEIDLDK